MAKERLPEESSSQEVGQHAVLAFERWYPRNWRIQRTDGDSDVGLDYSVQVVGENKYHYLFHAQVKGSRQKGKDGSNKRLSRDRKFYSQELKISTLNYYVKIGTDVMLVFVDLTQAENPRECKVYYAWLDEELERLLVGHDNLNHIKKATHSIRIPVTNVLDDSVDVLSRLQGRFGKRRALEGLYGTVAEHTLEPVDAINKLGSRLSNRTTLSSVLEESDNPWIDAPKGSFAAGLHKISDALKVNDAEAARRELEKLDAGVDKATEHERADYYYQRGRLKLLMGDGKLALADYHKAQKTHSAKKYELMYLETKLNHNLDDKVVCEDIASKAEGRTGVEYIRLRAKAFAFMKDKRALTILSGLEEKEVIIAKALIHLLLGQFKKCKKVCDKVISKVELKVERKLTMHIFRARCLFNLGFGEKGLAANEVVPFAGLPRMDDGVLRACWGDVVDAWDIGRKLGYPSDLAYIIDMSGILGVYFREIDRIYSHITRFAEIRLGYREVQEGLLGIAIHKQDYKTVRKQLGKMGESADKIVAEIFLEYSEKHRKRVVELILENIAQLRQSQPMNFDAVLLCAAECANELALSEAKDAILGEVAALPNSRDVLAAYNFYERVSRSQLEKGDAVAELYSYFEEGCEDKQIIAQLLQHLDSSNEEDCRKIIRVADVAIKERRLTWDETLKVAQAYAMGEKWGDVLRMSEEALTRFGREPRLVAIRAVALDAMGNTPEALGLLEAASPETMEDSYALEVYANIFARCGFGERARDLVTKLLEKTDDKKRKLQFFRMLFVLEMSIDHQSPRLLAYCEKYGELNNKEDEGEEGTYLQLCLLATLSGKEKASEQQKASFQKRVETYTENFPESPYLRAVHMKEGASARELLQQLEKVTGVDESVRERLRRNEELLKRGQMIVPFPVRRGYLLNVCDLLHLWEVSKVASSDDRQYHLVLEYGEYQQRRGEDLLRKVPLVDEISLLILNDLGLLGLLFQVFEKVAIARSTVGRLQNWGQHMISTFSPIAKSITGILRENIHKIYQPSCGAHDVGEVRYPELEEYRDIIKNNAGLVMYSDDAPSRLIVYGDAYKEEGMTTLDLIEIAKDRGVITQVEAARKIARMCSWNIGGISVKYLDILWVIKHEFTGREQRPEVMEKLDRNEELNHFIRYIWKYREPYKKCLNDIGSFVSMMISGVKDVQIPNNIVGCIWSTWYWKVALKTQAETSKLAYLGRSFCAISGGVLGRTNDRRKQVTASEKLWSIYNGLVEDIHGDEMSDAIYDESVRMVAKFAAESAPSSRDKMHDFIRLGIVEGTRDWVGFNRAYLDAAIGRDRQRR